MDRCFHLDVELLQKQISYSSILLLFFLVSFNPDAFADSSNDLKGAAFCKIEKDTEKKQKQDLEKSRSKISSHKSCKDIASAMAKQDLALTHFQKLRKAICGIKNVDSNDIKTNLQKKMGISAKNEKGVTKDSCESFDIANETEGQAATAAEDHKKRTKEGFQSLWKEIHAASLITSDAIDKVDENSCGARGKKEVLGKKEASAPSKKGISGKANDTTEPNQARTNSASKQPKKDGPLKNDFNALFSGKESYYGKLLSAIKAEENNSGRSKRNLDTMSEKMKLEREKCKSLAKKGDKKGGKIDPLKKGELAENDIENNCPSNCLKKEVKYCNMDMYMLSANKGCQEKLRALKKEDPSRKIICYNNAGTWQSGESDTSQFRNTSRGTDSWGEYCYNTSAVDGLLKAMNRRAAKGRAAGCDAMDWDNMDSFKDNCGGNMSVQQKYADGLKALTHENNMSWVAKTNGGNLEYLKKMDPDLITHEGLTNGGTLEKFAKDRFVQMAIYGSGSHGDEAVGPYSSACKRARAACPSCNIMWYPGEGMVRGKQCN